jgi:hypothetical protein
MQQFTDKPVKVFCLDSMTDTIFMEGYNKCFEGKGILFVTKASQADVIITRYSSAVTSLRRLIFTIT